MRSYKLVQYYISQTFFKCLYDYDPRADDLIPCQQAGLPFQCGDIVEVVSKTDQHWWQVNYLSSYVCSFVE